MRSFTRNEVQAVAQAIKAETARVCGTEGYASTYLDAVDEVLRRLDALPDAPESKRPILDLYGLEGAVQRPRATTPTPDGPALKDGVDDIQPHATAEDAREFLLANGFTADQIQAGLDKCMAMVREARVTLEPTAPEVVSWSHGGVRVVGPPGIERAELLIGPDDNWRVLNSIAYRILARALAQVTRETAPVIDALRQYQHRDERTLTETIERLVTQRRTLPDAAWRDSAESMRDRAGVVLTDYLAAATGATERAMLEGALTEIGALPLEPTGAAPATPESELRAYTRLVDAVRKALAQLRDGRVGRVGDAIATLSGALTGGPHA